MCGISGLVGFGDEAAIRRMTASQRHRGPDEEGNETVCLDPPVRFGHNRLRIIDLTPRGRQPMFHPRLPLVIIFNGEIYNFRELRPELERLGCVFRSATDTEVVLYAFERWGADAFSSLRGMFACAIYDGRTGTLTLARDRLGIKPLYYWKQGGRLAFASEIKALLEVEEIRASAGLDWESMASYLSLLWCPGPGTPFTGIRRLPPGAIMEWDLGRGQSRIRSYWSLPVRPDETDFERSSAEIGGLLEDVVRAHTMADVKVGMLLSGGLDSSLLSALTARVAPGLKDAFTIRFAPADQRLEAGSQDHLFSRIMSARLGLRLHEIEADPAEAADLLPFIVRHLDEPIGDPAAINTFLLARLAKEAGVTVLLSGVGADEIFAGYRKHLACLTLNRMRGLFPAPVRSLGQALFGAIPVVSGSRGLRKIRWMKRALAAAGLDLFDSYLALSRFLDSERLVRVLNPDLGAAFSDRLLRETFARPDSGPVNRMCFADTLLYLPGLNLNYADKATMAASIECRVPFCDHVLVEKAFRLPDRFKIRGLTQKAGLRRAAARFVPAEVLARPKAPFWAPLRSWLKGPWRGLVEDALSESRLRRQGFLNPSGVRELLDEDRRGMQDHAHAIFGLLTFQVWLDAFAPARRGGGEVG